MRKGLILLTLLALLTPRANAIVVSRITEFESGTPIIADDMNAELDNILSAINGNLSSENLVDNAVATENLGSYSVTKIKLGPLDDELSSSSGAAERATETAGNVANLTANITVVHRPVWVGLQAAGGDAAPGFVSYRNNGLGATPNSAYIAFNRNFSAVSKSAITTRNITNSTNATYLSLPCSAFWFIDTPGAGPHNYTATFRVASDNNGLIKVENCKLVVFEL
jgi:hypothetical protein